MDGRYYRSGVLTIGHPAQHETRPFRARLARRSPLNHPEQSQGPPSNGCQLAVPVSSRAAVVGSRQATSEGVDHAVRVTRALVNLDTTVVSGLAVEIDTVAHRSAIKAGGRMFAVIGTGPDRAYPARNRALQAHLATRLAIVSQFAPGSPVTRANFPLRNRTMVLLCDALDIVEAAETRGTTNQAWEALRVGRPVLLLEPVAENPALRREVAVAAARSHGLLPDVRAGNRSGY